MSRNGKILFGLALAGAIGVYAYRHNVVIPKQQKAEDDKKLKEIESKNLAQALQIAKKIPEQRKLDIQNYGYVTNNGNNLIQGWLTEISELGFRYSNGKLTKK